MSVLNASPRHSTVSSSSTARRSSTRTVILDQGGQYFILDQAGLYFVLDQGGVYFFGSRGQYFILDQGGLYFILDHGSSFVQIDILYIYCRNNSCIFLSRSV